MTLPTVLQLAIIDLVLFHHSCLLGAKSGVFGFIASIFPKCFVNAILFCTSNILFQ